MRPQFKQGFLVHRVRIPYRTRGSFLKKKNIRVHHSHRFVEPVFAPHLPTNKGV